MPNSDVPNLSCEQKFERLETEYRDFVNALSHDLAGPFRHIIGFSEMIMRANADTFDERTLQKFNFILTAGNDGKTMLDHLKAYARLTDDVAPMTTVGVAQMVDEVLEELDELIQTNTTKVEVGTLANIIASPELLRSTFYHILKNAILYSNTTDSPLVTITQNSTPTHIIYEFTDNGKGMTDYQIEKVVIVLKRAVSPNDYPGNGMGLAIAKKAIQYHNGSLDIESSPETGTKVSVSLPRL